MPGLLLSSLPNYSIWKISFGWTVPENGFLKQKVIRYPYSLAISAEKWRYQAVFAYTRPTNRSWHVLPGDVNLFQIIVRYRRALPYVAYHEWTSTQRPTNQWHMRYAGVRFRSRWRLQFRLWFEWKSTYLDACTVLLSKRRWITYRPCSFSVLGYITLSIIDRVTWYARCPYLDMAGTRSFPTRLLYQRTISKAGENDWIEAMSPERENERSTAKDLD